MELLTLSAGLILPWLGGTLWLMAVESRLGPGPSSVSRQFGYGFFLGYAVLTLAVISADKWLGAIDWLQISFFLFLFATSGGLVWWLGKRSERNCLGDAEQRTKFSHNRLQTFLIVLLAAWILFHVAFMALEVFSQPVYPWDAWQTWIYRAKAWYLTGGSAELVNLDQWAAATSPNVYAVQAAGYPLLPSIAPYWAALSLGRWSETLVNLPTLLAGLAIGLALYGQCRDAGMSRLLSLAGCYLLCSIPLFATHIALAGYADLWMAGYTGLGFVALLSGTVSKQGFQTAIGILLLGLALLVKNEAAVWLLAGLLMYLLTKFRWRSALIASAFVAALLVALFALGVTHVEVPLLGTLGIVDHRLAIPFIGSFALEVHDIWRAYMENLFVLGSWNLLWVLVGACLIFALLGKKPLSLTRSSAAVLIAIFLATQLFIFGFTDQGAWADTYTAINRLPIHFVPPLVFAALLVLHDIASQPATTTDVSGVENG